jgi:hypothetical protein
LIGCSSKKSDAPAAEPRAVADCQGAIDHSMSVETAEMAKGAKGLTPEIAQKIAAVAVQRCSGDGWSPAVTKCYLDGQTLEALDTCDALLTPEQSAKFHKAVSDSIAGQGCDGALDHAMPLEMAELRKQVPTLSDDVVKKFRDASVGHCKTDEWSPGVIGCLGSAKTAADLGKCPKLTTAQTDALDKDMRSILTAATGSAATP